MKVQGSTTMESLPSDIVQDIVSRVPVESVLECKLVCKKWGTLIRESNFTNMHLSRQLNHLHGGDDGNDNIATKVDACLFFACRIEDPDVFRSLLFQGGQLSHTTRKRSIDNTGNALSNGYDNGFPYVMVRDVVESPVTSTTCHRISIDEKYIYNENLRRICHPPMHNDSLYNHLVGSCNGLVCTFQHHHSVIDPIYICNPLTREYVYLPELVVKEKHVDPEEEANMYIDTACGFGYVRSTNEYKVVRIHYPDHREGNVEVYTLGSGFGWRAVGRVSYRLRTMKGGIGTYANDVIYWISVRKVVAFDLANEEFRLLSGPPCMQTRQNGDRCGLVALGRHLCLYMDKLRMEIWSLMKSKETWSMEFDIDYEAVLGCRKRKFQPILLTKKREIIFLYAGSVLCCYDTETKFLKMISNEAATDGFEAVEAVAHVNTFASFEAMGENSKRYPRRVCAPWDDVIDGLDRVALGEVCDTTHFIFR